MKKGLFRAKLLLSIVMAASLLQVGTAWGAAASIPPADDAYVYQSNATTNYGSAASMFVKAGSGAERIAYLKFPVGQLSGISSAKLRIYAKSSTASSLNVYQTTDAWLQGGITWNTKPAVGGLIGSTALSNAFQYVEIDVTSYIQAQAGGDGAASFVLSETAGKYTEIKSSESLTDKPQLLVVADYVAGEGDVSAPSVPLNLKALSISGGQIDLSWEESTDNVGVTAYDLYRNGTFIGSVTSAFASDTTGLLPSTSYSYYVKARDAKGNQSASSGTVAVATPNGSGPAGCSTALNTASAIQTAMQLAVPGTVIKIAPGTYNGVRATSGDPRLDASGVPAGVFYSGASGTASQRIILQGCDPANPPILQGPAVNEGSYGIHLTGDYWEIRDIKVTRAQKGIMIDNGNYNLLHNVEVSNIGDEGVHFRDGSSYNTLQHSLIHDTGNYQPGYGEGAYVGSDEGAAYEHTVIGNRIRSTVFGPGITAEHIDIKEGADGTLVESCTFNGTGITGANSADSFIDVKGVNSKVYNNTGSRNGNTSIADAFQNRTHGTSYPTGTNNDFKNNSVHLDGVGFVVNVVGGSAKVKGNTRTDGSANLYKGSYSVY
ncbi:DNRLRE domain-containing protein [Paenibacillus sp. GCM10027627]|uniref:CBM96 family carbohydrate-binding protein n=1 Tax=unclassified Paenibacillus TaxID=185978 RepID=UPI00363FCA15